LSGRETSAKREEEQATTRIFSTDVSTLLNVLNVFHSVYRVVSPLAESYRTSDFSDGLA
jgi:hypothetical protein